MRPRHRRPSARGAHLALWLHHRRLDAHRGRAGVADIAAARHAALVARCTRRSTAESDEELAPLARRVERSAAASTVCADRTNGTLEQVVGAVDAAARTIWDTQLSSHGNTATARQAVLERLAEAHEPATCKQVGAVLSRWAATWTAALHSPGRVLLHDHSAGGAAT